MQHNTSYYIRINRRAATCASVIVSVCTSFFFSGCASPQSRIDTTSLAPYAVHYYKRAWMEFDHAIFYKPDAVNDDADLLSELAPLLIEQVRSSNNNTASPLRIPHGIGVVITDANGQLSVDSTQPTIYTDAVVTSIKGVPYDQLIYVWWYPRRSAQSVSDLLMRGIRITLGKDGFPLVCEVLDDDEVDILFVTQTLENAANKAFGPKLSGRQFSAERSLTDAPRTVVARLLDDGPVPMGPYVYLLAKSREVSTLSCRCAASQIDRFVDTKYYSMLPLETLGLWGFQNVKLYVAFGDQFSLDQRLRWIVE